MIQVERLDSGRLCVKINYHVPPDVIVNGEVRSTYLSLPHACPLATVSDAIFCNLMAVWLKEVREETIRYAGEEKEFAKYQKIPTPPPWRI